MDFLNDIFVQAMEMCSRDPSLATATYNLFFSDLKPVDFNMETGAVLLSSPLPLKQQIVQQKYAGLIASKFEEILGFPVKVEILLIPDSGNREPVPHEQPAQDEFTFENFVVGAGNNFAYAASRRVAESPGTVYNPLFIYGRSGLGKTHLLRAIQNEILRRNPDARILYTSNENFANELVTFIQNKNMEEFRKKYRQDIDVLLIDDVQFLQNKERFQEEFFHTFEALTQVNKQIILTSDRPPKEIETLTDRLRGRFESGLLADIQPPDIETRMAIIKKKAEQYNTHIPKPVVEFIASKLKNNIRQLEGAVKRISATVSLNGGPVTLDIAESAIKDVQTDSMPVSVIVDKVVDFVANFYGITPADIKSSKRNANIVLARQVIAYVLNEITDLTQINIGQAIGGRNHSTVNYSLSLIKNRMSTDPDFKNTIFEIINNLQE